MSASTQFTLNRCNDQYLDVDDILATQERVMCNFQTPVLNMGMYLTLHLAGIERVWVICRNSACGIRKIICGRTLRNDSNPKPNLTLSSNPSPKPNHNPNPSLTLGLQMIRAALGISLL